MKIALISDIHGNFEALQAVLEHIDSQNVDQIICTGDSVNPFKESLEVWNLLNDRKIPILKGNHEDYIINHFENFEERTGWLRFNMKSSKLVADRLGPEIASRMKELPFELEIDPGNGDTLYICHASPISNRISFYDGISEKMEIAIKKVKSNTLVSGHRHINWTKEWKGKKLVSFGSVGLPLTGDIKAQYLVMSYEQGQWIESVHSVEYDNLKVINSYKESGWIELGGPISWLFCDQLLTGIDRLDPCIKFLKEMLDDHPVTDMEWEESVRSYLKHLGRWDTLSALIFD